MLQVFLLLSVLLVQNSSGAFDTSSSLDKSGISHPLSTTAPALKVPLKIVSILPSSSSPTAPYQLYGNMALTVVFSRPVIALGSDLYMGNQTNAPNVPFRLVADDPSIPIDMLQGKFRWVTTRIARFDLDTTWPTDLRFRLEINPGLTTWDGIGVDSSSPLAQVYHTTRLTQAWVSTHSPTMYKATNNTWNPHWWGSGSPELVPGDGWVAVTFEHEVSTSVLQRSLQVTPVAQFNITDCRGGYSSSTKYICLKPLTTLPKDVEYIVTLPTGTRYHINAGPLQQDVKFAFHSLRPFVIRNTGIHEPMFQRYGLPLYHGLASDPSGQPVTSATSAMSQAFQTATTMSPSVTGMTVEILATSHVLVTALAATPGTTYTVTLAANTVVTDIFGQPFQGGSLTVKPITPRPILLDAGVDPGYSHRRVVTLEQTSAEPWTIVDLGRSTDCGSATAKFASINAAQVATGLHMTTAYCPTDILSNIASLQPPSPSTRLPSTRSVATDDLFQSSSLVLRYYEFSGIGSNMDQCSCAQGLAPPVLLNRAAYHVTGVAADTTTMHVWVTSLSTGQPVTDAYVKLYLTEQSYRSRNPNPTKPAVIGEGRVDSQGLATITIGATYQVKGTQTPIYAMVSNLKSNNDLTIAKMPALRNNYVNPNAMRISASTDRQVYQEGERVRFKVFARKVTPTVVIPTGTVVTLSASWAGVSGSTQLATATIDADYGTASFDVPIDSRAQPGRQSFRIYTSQASTGTSVVLSATRLPVASLSFTAFPKVYLMNKGVDLKISTQTLTGSPLADSLVTIKWFLRRSYRLQHTRSQFDSPCPTSYYDGGQYGFPTGALAPGAPSDTAPQSWDPPTPDTTGVHKVTTGQDGSAVFSWTVPPGVTIEAGDVLSMQAEWFGPGGAFMTQELHDISAEYSTLDLQLSYTKPAAADIVPGTPFSLTIAVKNVVDDSPQSGVPVAVGLYQESDLARLVVSPPTGALSGLGNPVATCPVTSGVLASRCSFTLPSVGRFVVIATATDGNGRSNSRARFVGRSAASWSAYPFTGYRDLGISLDRESYTYGSTVQLTIPSIFSNVYALVTWGVPAKTSVVQVASGGSTVSLTVGDECIYGCYATVTLSVPQSVAPTLPSGVTSSKLYDASRRSEIHMTTFIEVNPTTPSVSIDVQSKGVYLPRDKVDLTITTRDADGTLADTDLWIVVVNKAIYNLEPTPLPSASSIANALRGSPSPTAQAESMRVQSDGELRTVKDTILRRLQVDPWTSGVVAWERLGSYPTSYQVDMSDAAFFSQYVYSLGGGGYSGSYYCGAYGDLAASAPAGGAGDAEGGRGPGGPPSAPQPAPSAPEAGANAKADSSQQAGSDDPVVRTTFTNVPYYAGSIKTGESGRATVSFTLPDNLGTFRIRILAAKKRVASFGAQETDIVVRRPGSLITRAPKFARIGDSFALQVQVALAPSLVPSTAVITVSGISSGLQLASLSRLTSGGSNAITNAVSFRFNATSLGEASLTLSAVIGDTTVDTTVIKFPILGIALPITMATSFSLDTGASSSEGLVLPRALPGSGAIDIAASVSHLSAVTTLSQSLLEWQERHRDRVPSIDLLASLIARPTLTQYGNPPASLIAKGEASDKTVWDMLQLYTNQHGLWYYPTAGRGPYYNTWSEAVSATLNVFAVFVASSLPAEQIGSPDLVAKWKAGGKSALARDAERARSYGGKIGCWDVASAFLAYGWSETFNDPDITTESLLARLGQCGFRAGARALTAYMRAGNSLSGPTLAMARRMENAVRVQGRTAYVASSESSKHPAGDDTQALYLEFQTLRPKGERPPLLDKIASYVAGGQSQTNRYFYRSDVKSSAFRTIGLAKFDLATDALSAEAAVMVASGSKALLSSTVGSTAGLLPLATSSTPWSDLPFPPPELKANATGTGLVTLAIGLSFTPAQTFPEPVYRGLSVQKVVQKLDTETGSALATSASNPATSRLTPGEFVRVTIQISTPDALRTAIRVEDPFPAGLEPIDPFISSLEPAVLSEDSMSISDAACASTNSRYRWWCPFNQMQFGRSSVVFLADSLDAGSYELTYLALVTIEGSFTFPSAIASVVEQPEVMGLTRAVAVGVGETVNAAQPAYVLTTSQLAAAAQDEAADPSTTPIPVFCGHGGDECPPTSGAAHIHSALLSILVAITCSLCLIL